MSIFARAWWYVRNQTTVAEYRHLSDTVLRNTDTATFCEALNYCRMHNLNNYEGFNEH